jgi:putative addiction module killer protein
MYQLQHYTSIAGEDLFGKWLDGLRDPQVRARLAARLIRLENGNLGDCKPIRGGVWELRLDFGPGYRVYYALANHNILLLCEGGDKRTQNMDIKTATKRWNEWQSRSYP